MTETKPFPVNRFLIGMISTLFFCLMGGIYLLGLAFASGFYFLLSELGASESAAIVVGLILGAGWTVVFAVFLRFAIQVIGAKWAAAREEDIFGPAFKLGDSWEEERRDYGPVAWKLKWISRAILGLYLAITLSLHFSWTLAAQLLALVLLATVILWMFWIRILVRDEGGKSPVFLEFFALSLPLVLLIDGDRSVCFLGWVSGLLFWVSYLYGYNNWYKDVMTQPVNKSVSFLEGEDHVSGLTSKLYRRKEQRSAEAAMERLLAGGKLPPFLEQRAIERLINGFYDHSWLSSGLLVKIAEAGVREEVLKKLLEVARHPARGTRYGVCLTLGRLKAKEGIPVLEELAVEETRFSFSRSGGYPELEFYTLGGAAKWALREIRVQEQGMDEVREVSKNLEVKGE